MTTEVNEQSYSATIEVALSPGDVFTKITDISKWWTKDIKGQTKLLNDEFIICSDCGHYSKHKLIEVIPDKKVVCLVTESKLDWVEKDKEEWTNTRMVFEIVPKGDMTELKFTHQGLVPELESYSNCVRGWDMFIKQSLYNFMTGISNFNVNLLQNI
jgi:hypothetical protein